MLRGRRQRYRSWSGQRPGHAPMPSSPLGDGPRRGRRDGGADTVAAHRRAIVGYFARCARLGSESRSCCRTIRWPLTCISWSRRSRRIIDAYSQVVMLKHEDCPGLAKLTRVCERRRGAHRRVRSWSERRALPAEELARGADGPMTGSPTPEMLVEVCAAVRRRRCARGEDLFDCYLPLLRHEAQPGSSAWRSARK